MNANEKGVEGEEEKGRSEGKDRKKGEKDGRKGKGKIKCVISFGAPNSPYVQSMVKAVRGVVKRLRLQRVQS